MLKYGRTYLNANERTMHELGKQLSSGAKRVAMRMFGGPDAAAIEARAAAKDKAVSDMCDILDQFATDPQSAWEAMNSLRILYEFRKNMPLGALAEEPRERKTAA